MEKKRKNWCFDLYFMNNLWKYYILNYLYLIKNKIYFTKWQSQKIVLQRIKSLNHIEMEFINKKDRDLLV